MQSMEKIVNCYNKVAENYAAEFADELSKKPFDCLLLRQLASFNKDKGPVADVGCGPGQTTRYLFDHGAKEIVGVDISPEMVGIARKIYPDIQFETGDIMNLSYDSNYFGSVLAFYAIVHFTYEQVRRAFEEIHRVLKNGGQFLFSFHVGNEIIHYDEFLEKKVDIDFCFFHTDEILDLLHRSGFKIIDAIERYPYKEIEYPSKRAYIRAEK